jgi:hypothetical protein
MDNHYYQLLRTATQEEYYEAINDPEHDLYDVVWDLFESVVIEPGEIFDPDFGNKNQFRYSIGPSVTLEFFPDSSYFEKRFESNPYRDDSDPAGIHLQFSVLPEMSCLFSVGLQVWGRPERQALRRLWQDHRGLLLDLLERSKPMVEKKVDGGATLDCARTLGEMLDRYFSVKDPENFIEFRYPFAQFDETDLAQNFMTYMALIYYAIRGACQRRGSDPESLFGRLQEFYSGHLPKLPPPLPCVEMVFSSDT